MNEEGRETVSGTDSTETVSGTDGFEEFVTTYVDGPICVALTVSGSDSDELPFDPPVQPIQRSARSVHPRRQATKELLRGLIGLSSQLVMMDE